MSGLSKLRGLSQGKRLAIIGGILGVGAASAIGVAAVRRNRKKRRSGNKRVRKTRRKGRKTRRRKTPRTAGKRKDTSKRRIRYTKNGQPYIILASGKARFIKNKSAKSSRKRKGGRY